MKPTFSIKSLSNGKEYAADWSEILEDLSISDQSDGKVDTLRVLLSDIGQTLEVPSRGDKIRVGIGEDGVLLLVGIYVIDEIGLEGPPCQIEIVGKALPLDNAAGWAAMQTRRSRSWDNITLGKLVAGIAAEHGLTPAVAPELASVTVPHIDQTSESNVSLLTRVARTYDGIFKVTSGKIVLASTNGGSMSGTAMPDLAVKYGIGMRYKCKFVQSTDFGCVKTEYHDLNTGETKAVISGIEAPSSKVFRDSTMQPDAATAKHRAKSRLKGFKKGSHGLSLDLPGLWQATCQQGVQTTGFRPEINGKWIIKKVEFCLSRSAGLRTRLDCEVPGSATGTAQPLGGIVPAGAPLGEADGSDDPDAPDTGEEHDSTEPTVTDS